MAVEQAAVDQLTVVRDWFLPMLRYLADEYRGRVPSGYPVILDAPERGAVGIELDPSHALYVMSDGRDLTASMSYRSSRYDTRASASREKYSGVPVTDDRPLSPDADDQTLRNLLAELTSRWNYGQTIIHLTDT